MNILAPITHWFQKRISALGSAVVAREQQTRINALLGADPDVITRAITAFDCGTLAPLARLVEAYERRDDKMMTCSMKMKASVGRCDYSILPREGFEGDARASRHAEILKRFWSGIKTTSRFKMNERGGIGLLKKQMMNAQSYGFAVHELVWTPLPNGELTCTFIEVPLWHFENRTGELRFLPEETAYDGVIMREGEWMVSTGDGIGIAAAICACLKRLTLADWAVFCQRCGMPVIIGKTGAAPGSEQWENLNAALRAIGRDARIQVDTATDISAINVGGGSAQPYTPLVEWADRAIAALYRGADLSTISQGGGGVGASLQGDETGMLEQDACNRLSETLQEQVERFVIRYVTGDDEPLAHIVIAPVSKQNVDEDIKIDQHLVSLGAKLSKNDALQRYGRTEADPEDPEDAPLSAPQPQPGLGGFANENTSPIPAGHTEAAGQRSQGQDLGEGASNVLAAFAQDTGPAADAIRALLADPSPEAAKNLLDDLPSLIPEDPALAAVIAEAMAAEFCSVPSAKAGGLENMVSLQDARILPQTPLASQ